MNNSTKASSWTQPIQLENWPTQLIKNEGLTYQLPIKEDWFSIPEIQETPFETEHSYQGKLRGEWLLVNFIKSVDPTHSLRNWVDQFIPIIGFPSLFIKEIEFPSPKLLDWNYEGNSPALAERLQVDEVHLYQGLANLPEPTSILIRLYVLVARRGESAWKFTLSFQSACPPGMDEEMIVINDHNRAGATFGFLDLSG